MPDRDDASSPRRVLVIDALGEVFDRLGELDLQAVLSRVSQPRDLTPSARSDFTIYAAYARIDWELLGQISSRAPILVITTTYQRGEAERALRADLVGYLDAGLGEPAFDRAVRGAVLRGEPAFPRDIMGAWMRERRKFANADNERVNVLTPRQREVLALVARGATDKEIAAVLGIAEATTQRHVTNMLRILKVPNRAAAVAVTRSRVPVIIPLASLKSARRNRLRAS